MSDHHGSKIEIFSAIVKDYFVDNEIAAIFLFGSAVGETFSDNSDIDVGILYKPGHSPGWKNRLKDQEELSERFGRDVDLVLLNQTSPILKYQVLKYGVPVCIYDKELMNDFFVRTLNEYFDLKQNRQIIERSLGNVSII